MLLTYSCTECGGLLSEFVASIDDVYETFYVGMQSCLACFYIGMYDGPMVDILVNQKLGFYFIDFELANEDQLLRLINNGSIEAIKYLSLLKSG